MDHYMSCTLHEALGRKNWGPPARELSQGAEKVLSFDVLHFVISSRL